MPTQISRSATAPRFLRSILAVSSVVAIGAAALVPLSAQAATQTLTRVAAAASIDYTKFVDPFMSTQSDNGQNIPGAEVPHGLAKPNPMTSPGRSHTGYDYAQTNIKGFTLSNLDGVGGSGAGGDLLVVPTYNTYTARPSTSTYALPFSHTNETATPGYYQVGLQATQGTINAELTATVRSGLEKFTFPKAGTASLVVDLQNNFTSRVASDLAVTILDDGRAEISGSVTGGFNGYNYKLYYDAVTNVPVSGVKTWGDSSPFGTATKQTGTDSGAVLSFNVTDGEAVQLTSTLSPISVAQARKDQAAELTGKTFDDVKQDAHDDWQDTLSKVAVTSDTTSDPDGSNEGIFYTSLYRMLATPTNATSTDGTYRGVDGKVHHADGYIHYDGWGTWDDFRKYSVLAYLYPDVYADVVQSLVDLYANDASVGSATLSSLTQSVPSVRFERSAIVIADAVAKGVHLDRLAQAYPAIVANANTYTAANQALGYIAGDPGTTVATSYDDYALSVIATNLGKTADAAADVKRSSNYKNVIKPAAWTSDTGTAVGVLSSKDAAGTFGTDDLEAFQAANLYQGTLWQFNWYPAQDMAGLITAMGGLDATKEALSHYFGEEDPTDGTKMLKSNANEVDLQTPYLFNYLGEPSKTQKWVRDLYTTATWQNYIATGQTDGNNPTSSNGHLTPPIKEKVFKLAPDGFLPTMDDDTGAMSATFVAAAVGLYPVTAGSSQYQVGTPFFPQVDISHADGTKFRVSADGVTPDDYYIQSATLNGKAYNNTWVDYSTLAGNGSFDATMGATASTWGEKSAAAFSLSTAVATTPAATVTSNATSLTADADGKVDGHITMTLAGATFAGATGDELVGKGLVSVTGLPAGVTATVTRTSSTALDVHVSGTLPSEEKVKFAVELTDGALANGASAASVTGTGLSTLDPYTILVTNHWRAALQATYDESRLVIQGSYTGATFDVFTAARASAKTVLTGATATDDQLQDAESTLSAAMDGLSLSGGGFRRLEGEQSDLWSGGADLHNESTQLGGVRPGAWVAYNGVSFAAGSTPSTVSVRYSGASNDGYANAAVEVHVGAPDGPLVATIPTPPTAATFGTYVTATADVTNAAALTSDGVKTVYFVFTGSGTDGVAHWVGNFDWMQFVDGDAATEQPLLSAGNATALASGINKTDPNLIQNVKNTDWAEYDGYDFGTGADTVSIRYDKPGTRTPASTSVEIHIDSKDSPAIATVPLTTTADGWGTYNTITTALPSVLTGVHNVYLVFLAPNATDALPYVGNISYAQFSLTEANHDGKVLQAEDRTDWGGDSTVGGNTMKTETSTWTDGTIVDVGNTHTGDWLHYAGVTFSQAATSISVHYVNNSSRCGNDSSIDVYLDSLTGTKVVNVPLPVTGSAWANSGTASVTLPTSITGTHDIYILMHTTVPDSNHPFVANFDSFTFNYGVDKTGLSALYAKDKPLLADSDLYVGVDFATFSNAMDVAASVLANPTAVASDVRAATQTLTLAEGQLDTRARRGLMATVGDATALDLTLYTKATAAALSTELATAQALVTADAASDTDYAAETVRLQAKLDALAVQPTTAPQAPTAVSAVADDRSLTVSWVAPADNGGSAITGYKVQLDGSASVTVAATATSYTFTGLARGHEYRASVVASNALGDSAASEYTAYVPIAALVPNKPGSIGIASVGSSVTVTWSAPDDNGSALTSYQVRLGDQAAVKVAASQTSYTFDSVPAGSYTAAVSATNAVGSSDFTTSSGTATVIAPVTVFAVSASAPSWSQVQVNWLTIGGADHAVIHVTVSKGSTVVASKDVWSDDAGALFTGLAGGTAYHVAVGVLGSASTSTTDVETPAQTKVHSHAVKITGTAKVGKKLGVQVHSASWTAHTKFTYVWTANGKKVGTSSTLKLTSKLANKVIKVKVTGARVQYASATVNSNSLRVKR